ncbi:ribonuclease HII [Facklamia sp. DSM 111018]|uniref:Ribonuclease HII n=1 Tax=Facklamia lactis TaxID=2749967 RepID=A0ABS0LPN1_9LACT|nr:ribonuclease HII [Facklamia lactis]MBG9979984.1 ribonuclease HII [Facklamia lactis]MBG9985336.1 ribonuclease HII [Facklamia lactis]
MRDKSIKEIKALLSDIDDPDHFLFNELKEDSRIGVQKIIQQKYRELEKKQKRYQDYLKRLDFENEILDRNPRALIAGLDEVGRGPIAGPVVAAAVILPDETKSLFEVNDSKLMSHHKRTILADLIKKEAKAYSIVEISPEVIDKVNIYEASRLAMAKAAEQLSPTPHYLLIDAMKIDSSIPQQSIVKGDQKSLSIAAASIIAKVYRDELMKKYAEIYPEFGFERHMGYPTKDHLNALNVYGATPIHRQSFGPVMTSTKKYRE